MTSACCCGETGYFELFSSRDLLCGNDGEWKVVRCNACLLLRTFPQPDEKQLESYYPSDYQPHLAVDPPSTARKETLRRIVLTATKKYSGVKSIWRHLLGKMLAIMYWKRFLIYPHFRPNGLLLDIGCGNGHKLKLYRDLGWQVIGVDNSISAIDQVRRRGIEAVHGTVESASFNNSSFDVITMSASLEHVTDPLQTLTTVHRLLRPNGELIISVPRADSWLARLAGPHWFPLDLPRHLYHFTPKSLENLLTQIGFSVCTIRSIQPKEFVVFSWIYHMKRAKGQMDDAPLRMNRIESSLSSVLSSIINLCNTGDMMYLWAKRNESS